MCSILGYLCFTFPPIRYKCAVGMLRPIRRLCRADSRTQWKLSKYLTAVLTKAHKSYPLPARRQQHSIRKVPSYPLLDWFQSVLLTDPNSYLKTMIYFLLSSIRCTEQNYRNHIPWNPFHFDNFSSPITIATSVQKVEDGIFDWGKLEID